MKNATLQTVRLVLLLVLLMGVMPNLSAQCESFENFPEGVKKARQTHVLYRDFVKNKQYKEALPLWEQLMEYSSGGSVLYYIDGIEMMKSFLENTTDETEKTAYTQRIIDLYEQRIQCWSAKRKDELSVRESMAYDMYALDYDAQKTLDAFENVLKVSKGKPAAYLLEYHADHAVRMFYNDLLKQEQVIDLYHDLLEITERNIQRNESDKEDYENAEQAIRQIYEEGAEYIFDCEYFVKKMIPIFQEQYDDLKSCEEMKQTLQEKSCENQHPFLVEVTQRIKMLQDSIDHKNRSNWVRGGEAEELQQYEKAIDYYFKSIELKEIDASLDRKYYRIAQNYYVLDNKLKSREFALEAIEENANWGKPYILIGKLYAASAKSCKGTFQGRAVFWVAVDMWQKAKKVDDMVTSEANQLIQTYQKYFPDKETVFQLSLKDGQSYKVGCWIQRTTRIRSISKY